MTELKVGLFALLAMVGVVYMSLRVTQDQSGFGEHVPYRTIISDAAGIFPKTPIKIAGITAGRIKKIELVGNQALVTFEVLKSIKVTKKSILRIKSVGFLGDKYLDILVNEREEERLAQDELIPSQMGGGIEELAKDAGEVLADIKAITGALKVAVAPDDQQKPLAEIINNIGSITRDAKEMAKSLRDLVGGNGDKFKAIIANLEKLSSTLVKEADSSQADSLMATAKKMGPMMEQMKKVLDEVQVVMTDVRNGKGTVGRLLRDDEIVDKVTETLSGVNKIVNKVNAIQTELGIYTGINTENGNASSVNLDIYPSPERYYRVGVVTSELGPANEKEIKSTNANGVTTVEERKETVKNTYRFNLMIGRRIQSWGMRAGIIESTGGVGLDYYLRRQGSIFSFEAFDYRKSLGPNLRFLSEFHIWNVIYARLALEDLISKSHDQSMTVGAGLRFTDEDLKGIIGFLF